VQYNASVSLLPNNPNILRQTLLLGALGNLLFFIGYRSRFYIPLAKNLPKFNMRWNEKRVVVLAVVFSFIGTAGYIFAITRSGGFYEFVSTLQGRSLLTESKSQVFAASLVLVNVAATILGAYYFKVKKLGVLFLACLALSIGFGLLQGGRASVLLICLALFVMYHYLRTPRRIHVTRDLLATCVFALINIVVVVILGTLRKALQMNRVEEVTGFGDIGNRFLEEFSQFDWFAIIIDKTPDVIHYQYGRTFLDYFLQFVPRLIWPDKPVPIEYAVTTLLTGVESGSPFTIIGELYLNFQWPGIMLGMFIFGVFVRSLYAYLKDNPGNPAVILIYGIIFANLFHLYTRSFAPMMFFLTIFVVPAVWAIRWIEIKIDTDLNVY
jgi:oligosaccharide repeat unit polymerase